MEIYIAPSWGIKAWSLVGGYQPFRGTCCYWHEIQQNLPQHRWSPTEI